MLQKSICHARCKPILLYVDHITVGRMTQQKVLSSNKQFLGRQCIIYIDVLTQDFPFRFWRTLACPLAAQTRHISLRASRWHLGKPRCYCSQKVEGKDFGGFSRASRFANCKASESVWQGTEETGRPGLRCPDVIHCYRCKRRWETPV